MWRNRTLHTLLMGMQNGAAILESLAGLQRVKQRELPYDPALLPVGDRNPRKMKTDVHTKTPTHMFTAALFITKSGNKSNVYQLTKG